MRSDRICMGKLTSKVATILGRLIKAVIVVMALPVAIGLLQGIEQQLDIGSASWCTFLAWTKWGFVTYLWVHILLYRPVAVFQFSHRLFSAMAVWLFGGQVASTQHGGGKGVRGGKGAKSDGEAQGSPLVAFSPYVIPLYTVLMCAAGWMLRLWVARLYVDGPVSWLIGATIAFHWLMTADELQQQRSRWHLETYLLAVALIFTLTLLVGGACLPLAIPEFSFARALGDGLSHTHAIYTTILQRLFF